MQDFNCFPENFNNLKQVMVLCQRAMLDMNTISYPHSVYKNGLQETAAFAAILLYAMELIIEFVLCYDLNVIGYDRKVF